ncbi:MAG TPA: hypothetical protein DEB31_08460 [Clostridiales bacterium]|nr:hypothetical protein [Clostridiales bacterium]
MKRIPILLLCIALAICLGACAAEETPEEGNLPSPDEPEPVKIEKTIAGMIDSAEDTDAGVRLLVTAGENDRSVYGQAYVLIDGNTSVGEIGQYFNDTASAFKPGAVITVYTDGAGAQGEPPELYAVLIQLA